MIDYRRVDRLTKEEFIDVLVRSTLAERRPVDDETCIQGMLDHANLTIGAYEGDRLVGIARSVTDFHYCCYLSDLAVDQSLQRGGVGKGLIRHTQEHLGPRCRLILLSAPKATTYYERLGFEKHPSAWTTLGIDDLDL